MRAIAGLIVLVCSVLSFTPASAKHSQWDGYQVQWSYQVPQARVQRPSAHKAHRSRVHRAHHARSNHRKATVTNKKTGPVVPVPQTTVLSREVQDADLKYLVETATPGGTMKRQGPILSIARLHPEFRHRLAEAIKDAREHGLRNAGLFSAYRPPGYGVGGFRNKFNSLHAYGLAVDMAGIGHAGSSQTILWHKIAKQHGVIGPYGPYNRAEWNHMQPCFTRIVTARSIIHTITSAGPRALETMWDAGTKLIASLQSVLASNIHTSRRAAHRVKHYRRRA